MYVTVVTVAPVEIRRYLRWSRSYKSFVCFQHEKQSLPHEKTRPLLNVVASAILAA
jgi:hypothetical protein